MKRHYVLFGYDKSLWSTRFSGAMYSPGSSSSAKSVLDYARSKGYQLLFPLAGSSGNFSNSDDSLSLSKWKYRVARFKGFNFDPWVQDGTLLGNYMVDEPNDQSNWGGTPVPYSTIQQMAQYSKSLYPTLPTICRVVPTWFLGALSKGIDVSAVDCCIAQYSARKGDVTTYAASQVSAATKLNQGLVFSMNILDGGDGSSKHRGTKSTSWWMSAAELRKYGSVLAPHPKASAFMNWKYTDEYMNNTGNRSALADLKALVDGADAPRLVAK